MVKVSKKYVCCDCLDTDYYLERIVIGEGLCQKCSYCGRRQSVFSFDRVIELVEDVFSFFYSRALEELPYDKESEFGFFGDTTDTHEIIHGNVGYAWCDALKTDVLNKLSAETYCKKYPFLRDKNDSLRDTWQEFNDFLKYRYRFMPFVNTSVKNLYFHTLPSTSDDPDNPCTVVDFLEELCGFIQRKFFIHLPEGSPIYRARSSLKTIVYNTPEKLGTPPPQETRAGRLNPAGIAHFYGCNCEDTAILEITQGYEDTPVFINMGTWKAVRELRLIDLSSLVPRWPSIYDPDERQLLGYYRFLKAFVHDISQPIEKDGKEHIEYVPTQVLSEYMRCRLWRGGVDGIYFDSAASEKGKNVVFYPQDGDCKPEDGRLEFIKSEQYIVSRCNKEIVKYVTANAVS